jgi:hypothetical protein
MTYQRRRIKRENNKPLVATPTPRRRRLPFGECPSCDRDGQQGPSHDPSPHCESGKHPHCTCDTCF